MSAYCKSHEVCRMESRGVSFFHYLYTICVPPSFTACELHQPRLWFITGGYLVKRWFIPAATRARGQSNDLNRELLASNLFNCHKKVINTPPPVPSISICIHIVYRHKNVWEYQWSSFIYNCMSIFLHYVRCKDALLDCSAPGGEMCESLTWVDEIRIHLYCRYVLNEQNLKQPGSFSLRVFFTEYRFNATLVVKINF